jgi:hypothetical protein
MRKQPKTKQMEEQVSLNNMRKFSNFGEVEPMETGKLTVLETCDVLS